jgi:hypothetical protein
LSMEEFLMTMCHQRRSRTVYTCMCGDKIFELIQELQKS